MEEKKLYNAVRKIITLADGRQIEIETGKLAKQADGSVVVKMGDTMLLGTVVAAKDAKPDTDFMPLQVEYKEKYAACGRYPGGFMKREGKANDSEVLVARLIDRALRPLFPADYHAEVYVTVNLISADKDIQPDALAGLAALACGGPRRRPSPFRTSPSAAPFRRFAWLASTATTSSTPTIRRWARSTSTSWSAVRSTTS